MTNSIKEIDGAKTIFVIGANTTNAHPVIGQRMRRAAQNGTKLIVANPKEIDLVNAADYFIQHRPGSDTVLLMGMCRYIIEEDLHDKEFIAEHVENFEAFQDSLKLTPPSLLRKSPACPGSRSLSWRVLTPPVKPAQLFYAMGITQHSHGTDNVMAVANLAMLTGNIGKEFHRCQSAAGTEQRAGSLRYGRSAQRLPRIPECHPS